MTSPDRLLSEFADAWSAGLRPDAAAFIDRAPPGERAELAEQITAFLAAAPEPAYDEAGWGALAADPALPAVASALDAPSWATLLPELRARAGLSLDALAGALGARLGLRRELAPKTRRYLEAMERERLFPARVTPRLLDALADALGASAEALAAAGRRGPAAAGALYRRQEPGAVDERFEIIADALLAPGDWDEVDELFQGER
jgi:transcriptional regulator with XRE-family HTH domain